MLAVMMYHYVRPRGSRFPALHSMDWNDFTEQVEGLASEFEMATLESAMAYIEGTYKPKRDLCLLTFDDGLNDHGAAAEYLKNRGLSGVFFVPTAPLDGDVVLDVHKNHLLMATLDFGTYRGEVLKLLGERLPRPVPFETVQRTYRWDRQEVAEFKYMLNFQLDAKTKTEVLSELLCRHVGDECALSRYLYLRWPEVQLLQRWGMSIGGHAKTHTPLAGLSAEQQAEEVELSHLKQNCLPQDLWAFAYPNGSRTSQTDELLKREGYCCAFLAGAGALEAGCSPWSLLRLDPKDVDRFGLLPKAVAC